MITAFVFSTLFLVSYIVHHALHGNVRYPANAALAPPPPFDTAHEPCRPRCCGAAYGAGYVLLFAHWATFRNHRRIARWTFPLWLYVSVTGVITYAMLQLAQG